jgi:hypothetical protein
MIQNIKRLVSDTRPSTRPLLTTLPVEAGRCTSIMMLLLLLETIVCTLQSYRKKPSLSQHPRNVYETAYFQLESTYTDSESCTRRSVHM